MRSRTLKAAIAFLGLSALTGCATVYEGKYNFRDGWREAKVVSLVPGAGIDNPRFWECTRKLTKDQREATAFVLLSYRGMRRQTRRMVPAPAGVPLAVGERVYLKADACEQAIAIPAAH
jgi:hypothetical protein